MSGFDWPAAGARIESGEGRDAAERLFWSMIHARVFGADDDSGFSRLPAAGRDAFVVHELLAELRNGGYHQYFSNSSGDHALLALDALRRLGSAALADLHHRALLRFDPTGHVPMDRDVRNDRLDGLGQDEDASYAWFRALDEEFTASDGAHDPDVYAYALANAAAFAFTAREWDAALEQDPHLLFPADRQVTAVYEEDVQAIRITTVDGSRDYPLASLRSLDIAKRRAGEGASGLAYVLDFDDDVVRVPFFARGPAWKPTPHWPFVPSGRRHRLERLGDALAEARSDAPMESITLWVRGQGAR